MVTLRINGAVKKCLRVLCMKTLVLSPTRYLESTHGQFPILPLGTRCAGGVHLLESVAVLSIFVVVVACCKYVILLIIVEMEDYCVCFGMGQLRVE